MKRFKLEYEVLEQALNSVLQYKRKAQKIEQNLNSNVHIYTI